jgi:anti-sigma factor RsiW
MPMDHDRWEQMIPDFLSGRLSQAEGEELRHHIASCSHCSQAVGEFRNLFGELDAEKARREPPQYFNTVLPRVRARLERSPSDRLERRVPDLALAAAALVLVVAFVLTITSPPQGALPTDRTLAQAIGDVPADVLAEVLEDQAAQAGVIEQSSAELLSDELLDNALATLLTLDQAPLGVLDVRGETEAYWFPELNEQEMTTLLQRLSERELL